MQATLECFVSRVLPSLADRSESLLTRTRALSRLLPARPCRHPLSGIGSVKLLLNYFSKGANVVHIPTFDEEMALSKHATTGRGCCTMCVICAVNLPLVDVKSGNISTYVEVVAGESKTSTKIVESRCPVFNAPFMLELTPDAQVCELIIKAKPSKLNVSKGDKIVGVASILLSGLPEDLSSSWHDVVPLKAAYGSKASVKVTTLPHLLPQLSLNYPRREVVRIRDNASKGLGTMEVVVVSAKQLMADPVTGTRTAVAVIQAGNRKGTIEGGGTTLNPVWNKPLTLEIDPDVEAIKLDVLDKSPSAQLHKLVGSVSLPFNDWPEGEEIDEWYPLNDADGFPTKSLVRVWSCYVQRINYIDPAERGIIQGAIGDVEVVCIAARGVGIPQLQRPGGAGGSDGGDDGGNDGGGGGNVGGDGDGGGGEGIHSSARVAVQAP